MIQLTRLRTIAPRLKLRGSKVSWRHKMGINFNVRQWGKGTKIMVSWAGILFLGVSSFILTKRQVDRNRYDIMKSKERMRNANLSIEDSDKSVR